MRYTLLVFSLLATLFMHAQGSGKDGYVVLNNGDTLRGLVEEASWNTNPESIVFRSDGTPRTYRVTELKGFGIGNEVRYVRFHFTYQQTATELEHADETFDGPSVTTDGWLKVLYGAPYSLYEWVTNRRTYFYYTGPDGDLKELIYRVRLTVSGELEKDEQYKNRLSSLAPAQDGEAYQRLVNNARYTDDDLVKIFGVLNGGGSTFKAQKGTTTRIDISGGLNLFTFNPDGDLYNDGSGAYSINTADFKTSTGFVVGVGLTFRPKRNPKGVQSRLGVNISSVTIDGLNTTGTGSFQREKYDGTLIIAEPNASIDFPLSVTDRNAFLLGAGFGYNIVVSNNFKSIFENPGVVVQRKNFPPVDGGFINFGLNATAILNRHRVNVRAFTFTNIFDSPRTNLKGMGFNLTYGFFVK